MSFDTELRGAFDEETWEVDTGAALRDLHERAHRARVWKGAAVAGAAAVALLAGFGAVLGHAPASTDRPSGPVSTATATSSPGRSTAPTAIDGTWKLGPVTAAQIHDSLRAAGQHQLKWYRTVIKDQPKLPLSYRMTIGKGRVDVVVTGADGVPVQADQEYVALSGRQAELEPLGTIGVNRYRWALVDGRLRLTFVSTSESREDISPYGALQRALYTVGEWTRVGRR